MSAGIIEKDVWVCWCLRRLFSLNDFRDHLTFKGHLDRNSFKDLWNSPLQVEAGSWKTRYGLTDLLAVDATVFLAWPARQVSAALCLCELGVFVTAAAAAWKRGACKGSRGPQGMHSVR